MKIVLQGFEPQPAPATRMVTAMTAANGLRRKPRIRFVPAATDTRLFHAL